MAARIRRVTIREDPYEVLGNLIAQARADKRLTINSAWRAARVARPEDASGPGISKSTWEKAEVKHGRISPHLYADIETLFGWESGSILRYLDKNGPEPGPAPVLEDINGEGNGQTLVVHYSGTLSPDQVALIEDMVRHLARDGA